MAISIYSYCFPLHLKIILIVIQVELFGHDFTDNSIESSTYPALQVLSTIYYDVVLGDCNFAGCTYYIPRILRLITLKYAELSDYIILTYECQTQRALTEVTILQL